MSKAIVLPLILISLVCVGCQERLPAMEDLEVLTVEGSSVRFYREKPITSQTECTGRLWGREC